MNTSINILFWFFFFPITFLKGVPFDCLYFKCESDWEYCEESIDSCGSCFFLCENGSYFNFRKNHMASECERRCPGFLDIQRAKEIQQLEKKWKKSLQECSDDHPALIVLGSLLGLSLLGNVFFSAYHMKERCKCGERSYRGKLKKRKSVEMTLFKPCAGENFFPLFQEEGNNSLLQNKDDNSVSVFTEPPSLSSSTTNETALVFPKVNTSDFHVACEGDSSNNASPVSSNSSLIPQSMEPQALQYESEAGNSQQPINRSRLPLYSESLSLNSGQPEALRYSPEADESGDVFDEDRMTQKDMDSKTWLSIFVSKHLLEKKRKRRFSC